VMERVVNSLPHFSALMKGRMDARFIRYARAKFPDISDQLIQRNLCEIITAYDAEYKCKSCCMGIDMCSELINSAGYTYRMIFQPSGWIKIVYVPCMFNGGKEVAGSPLPMPGGGRGGALLPAGCEAG